MSSFVSVPHRPRILPAVIGALGLLFPALTRADNPVVQTIYTADPAPMVHEGKVYLYTTHDEDVIVNNFFTMNDWRVFSSTDMVNWTHHGSPLSYKDFTWAKGDAWAGQCVPRNGKFYFYVPMTQKSGGNAIGVAVSDSPTGPFKDALGKPLATTGTGDIDPTVFIDTDGQAYLYWGNPKLWYVKLNEDMISYPGKPTEITLTTAGFGVRSKTDRATTYEEGPWFYKRNSLYYMVFAAGPISEHIGYSTATGPTGPWTYRGVVMAPEGASFTNHPGVIDYKGGSYFFYHNGALTGGGGYNRSVSIEKFTYNADGTIPTMKMSKDGAPAADTLNPFVTVEAETIAWESGVETETCSEGGLNVTAISNGDYIKVKNVNFSTGADSFEARVAAAAGGGSIELYLGSLTGTKIATCPIAATGGATTWKTVTCDVTGATGAKDLFLKFTGGTGELFKFNWWKFSGPGAATAGGDAGVADTGADPVRDASGTETRPSADGASGSGGAITGGAMASGGSVAATGGATRTGGQNAATGGAASAGGQAQTGGNTTAAGGASSSGGALPPSGGSMSTGGVGSGGAANTGGAVAKTGGAVAKTGGAVATPDSGCGCKVGGTRTGTLPGVLLLLAGVLLAFRRKRTR